MQDQAVRWLFQVIDETGRKTDGTAFRLQREGPGPGKEVD